MWTGTFCSFATGWPNVSYRGPCAVRFAGVVANTLRACIFVQAVASSQLALLMQSGWSDAIKTHVFAWHHCVQLFPYARSSCPIPLHCKWRGCRRPSTRKFFFSYPPDSLVTRRGFTGRQCRLINFVYQLHLATTAKSSDNCYWLDGLFRVRAQAFPLFSFLCSFWAVPWGFLKCGSTAPWYNNTMRLVSSTCAAATFAWAIVTSLLQAVRTQALWRIDFGDRRVW